MSKDPIRAALEAAVKPIVDNALAEAKRKVIAAIESAFAGVGSAAAPRAKREGARRPASRTAAVTSLRPH